jgi:dephospho-CoA kinase
MKKPLQIGLTGAIGSGKTTVAKIFEALGIPVYYSDDRSKNILQNNTLVKNKIVQQWGNSVLDAQGNIDRKALASLVFAQAADLQKLNAILHPLVAADYQLWFDQQKGVPYVVKEAAILVESGSHVHCDKIIVVEAPERDRLARVIARDGVNEHQVQQRNAQQMPQSEKIKFADYIIHNIDQKLLLPQVMEIHHKLIQEHGNFNSATK